MCCLTIDGSKLFLMGTGQNLFVQNLSLLVLPLFEKAGCLENTGEKMHFSVLDQMGLLNRNVPHESTLLHCTAREK